MRNKMISDEEYIQFCEENDLIDSNCKTCQKIFYPAIKEGKSIMDVFAPRHKASERCQSGKHPHCSCDTCF